MQRYENIDKKLKKELQKIDQKLESDGTEMTSQDIEMADCLFHALKSAETYYAMAESGEMGYSGDYGSGESYGRGNSYARGRDSRGRYTSREMGMGSGFSGYPPMSMYPRYNSYEDGMSMRY